jgi:flavin reductase (DIM6/NTAB) family NADH-FMN oxidoreductase RutF
VKGAESVNTMTISWGFVGVMWGKPYFICMVRTTRYTKELIDVADSFTISIPWGTLQKELAICGSKSGRDIDKSQVVKFAPAKSVDSPIVSGCQTYIECKIRYADPMESTHMPTDVLKTQYHDDFHTFYFGEIVNCYGA